MNRGIFYYQLEQVLLQNWCNFCLLLIGANVNRNWGSFILLQIGANVIRNWAAFLFQIGASVITNQGSLIITNQGKLCNKSGQLLQIRANVITNWGSYYILGQTLLQNRAAITNWGNNYKLGYNNILSSFNLQQQCRLVSQYLLNQTFEARVAPFSLSFFPSMELPMAKALTIDA